MRIGELTMHVDTINTGLFFGSFNPVHKGHLRIAGYLINNEGLDEIWFVVSPQNPLKGSEGLANPQQRLEMMKLAIASEPRLKICDVEFSMPKPSYTFNTLQLLTSRHACRKFHLIIGSDNLEEFQRWKNHEQILENYKILVYPRRKKVKSPFDHHPNVKLTQAQLISVSSTEIRQSLKQNKDVRKMLPEAVCRYIISNGLYCG